MTVTSGFFNSISSDRKYDARQMSEIFDGIINDGVYQSIGDRMIVSTSNNLNSVLVGTGRCWFNHVWVKVWPSKLEVPLPAPDEIYTRYDAIVVEIDHQRTGRFGTIKYVKGTASSNPIYPVLVKSGDNGVNQYPLAYIRRRPNVTLIATSDLVNQVGTSACPFVTGPLKVLSIDDFWAQWSIDWQNFLTTRGEETDEFIAEQKQIFNQNIFEINEENHEWITETHQAFEEFWQDSAYKVTDLIQQNQMEFTEWFEELQVMLEDDVAANLAAKILRIDHDLDTLAREQTIYRYIEDSDNESVLDSNGQLIGSATVFELKHIF